MALAETTLGAACDASASSITVASATSIAVGRMLQIDDEIMMVAYGYVTASTSVPVRRGLQGSVQEAHVTSARIVHGDPSDFPSRAGAGNAVNYPLNGWTKRKTSVTATSTLTLPTGGTDLLVVLNGTSVITLTIPVPTKDLDGTEITFVGNGAAAHVLTFTGGLSGAGGGYTTITVNATKPIPVRVIACNEVWLAYAAVPLAGTVTNVTGTVA
jgi:hypothetical protein